MTGLRRRSRLRNFSFRKAAIPSAKYEELRRIVYPKSFFFENGRFNGVVLATFISENEMEKCGGSINRFLNNLETNFQERNMNSERIQDEEEVRIFSAGNGKIWLQGPMLVDELLKTVNTFCPFRRSFTYVVRSSPLSEKNFDHLVVVFRTLGEAKKLLQMASVEEVMET